MPNYSSNSTLEANMILSENAVSLVTFSNVHIPTR